jgi:Glycosyl transferase family 2
MKVVGISMVRNEADIITQTVCHMAYHCDHLIISDNRSDDGTREILDDLAKDLPLDVATDPDPAYYQARKMTALAELAATRFGDEELWIVPFDADELWNPWDDPNQPIRELLVDRLCCVAQAALFDYRATALDPPGVDPVKTMQWCTVKPAGLPKVAFRWQEGAQIHQGNHGVDLPDGGMTEILLRVNHFPYRSASQFVAKALQGAVAYEATDLPEDMGAHWRAYGRLYQTYGQQVLEDVFRQYFWTLSPTDGDLIHQPVTYHGNDL